MFETIPGAEIPFSAQLFNGTRTWWWVELGLNIPVFVATIEQSLNMAEGTILVNRHFFLTDVSHVTELAREDETLARLIDVSILIPDHISRDNGYQFGHINEIWGNESRNDGYMLMMADGNRISFPENTQQKKMKLILKLR